jgi:hypothetical protein
MIFGIYVPYEDCMNARVKPAGKFENGDINVTVIEVLL